MAHQDPIRKLKRLLECNALDKAWHPHTLLQTQALAMSADTFQRLINDQGMVLVIGKPEEYVLDHRCLLTLSSENGNVACFGMS
jgi:hypothetical protein